MNAAQFRRTDRAADLASQVALVAGRSERQPSACRRLEEALGRDLAARLLYALAGDHRARPRVL